MSWGPFLWMLGVGAASAFLLALAVSLAYWRPQPKRVGFEVRYVSSEARRRGA